MFDGKSFIISLPAIIKAHTDSDGRRMVEVEVSSQDEDSEGDVILQKALMDSAEDFIRSGHCDIDHISELGSRLGIPNPSSYIVGRPIEVKDYGNGRTGVVSEIRRSADGRINPMLNKYDEFWESLITNPPVKWSASIYGFPKAGMIDDCRTDSCDIQASRYVVRGIDWRSFAFTTKPVNGNLTRYAEIVTAKAFIEILKGASGMTPVTTIGLAEHGLTGGFEHDTHPPTMQVDAANDGQASGGPATGIGVGEVGPIATSFMSIPKSMSESVGQLHTHIRKGCEFASGMNSVVGFKSHFQNCCGASEEAADLLSHALMYYTLLEKRRGS